MINFIVWLIIGAFLGWLAGMAIGDREGMLRNILVGSIGAFIGGAFNLFSKDAPNVHMNDFSISSLLVSFVGAFVLLGIVNLFRRDSMR
jgi:uncharacterized membrane protein YeaQ/YmgE (transglycosylase-associated protein family)